MSIQEHLNKIRNAIKGSEVRESIAKGIETAYDDASEKDNANMEVKIARGTHPNLRSRLEEVDNKQQQTTAQLAQNKQELGDKTDNLEVDLRTDLDKKIDKHGAMQVEYANLNQEIREMLTGGNTAVVGKDSVGYPNVIKKSLTGDHLKEFSHTKANLFNPYSVTNGYRIGPDGGLFEDAVWSVSDFIDISDNGGQIRFNFGNNVTSEAQRVAYFDSNRNFVRIMHWFQTPFNRNGFSLTENSGYIKVAVKSDQIYNFQVVFRKDEHLNETDFRPYGFELEKNTFENIKNQFLASVRGHNVYFEVGTVNSQTGLLQNSESRVRTGLIKAPEFPTIINSKPSEIRFYVVQYDNNLNHIFTSSFGDAIDGVYKFKSPYYRIVALHTPEAVITDLSLFNNAFSVNNEMIDGKDFLPFSVAEEKLSKELATKINSLPSNDLYGKTLLNIGDSIATPTAANEYTSYAQTLANKYGMILYSESVGGATMADKTPNQSYIFNQYNKFKDENSGVNPDFILVNGMTNDIANSTIGVVSDGYDTVDAVTTFAGGMENLIRTMKSDFPGAIIIYVFPHKMDTRSLANQKSFCTVAKSILDKYSIKRVDMFNEGLLNTFIPEMKIYAPDGTHPNKEGNAKFYSPMVEKEVLNS